MTAIPSTVEELIDVIEGIQQSATINELTNLTSLAHADLLPIWDTSVGQTKNITAANFSLAIDQILDAVAPGPVTNASVTPIGITGHKLSWTNPDDTDLKYVEIYRVAVTSGAAVPSFAAASFFDLVAVPRERISYSQTYVAAGINPSKDYYYWLVAVDGSGNQSDETYAGSVLAAANPSIEDIMDELTGDIRYEDLSLQLTTQYDLLDSSYVLAVNANGHVSGMVFVNDGSSSIVTFVVDKFAIVQSDGLNTIVPFVVGTVDGTPTVGINGQLIVNGTIKTYSLDVDDVFVGNSIESSDYSGGVTGWKLFGDGTAVFRGGSITISSTEDIEDFPDVIKTFYASSPPTAENVGDIWFDTSDGNAPYRWDGFDWILVKDSDVALAISNAATAQSTADGKIVTFYQDEAPTGVAPGDLWADTNDGYHLYRWDSVSSTWEDMQDTAIANAQSTADGKIVTFYATAPPTAEGIGDLWFDTDDGNRLYRASAAGSGSWVEIPTSWNNIVDKGRFADAPSGTGLFMTDDYIGFYTSSSWRVYIQNDSGTGKLFMGNAAYGAATKYLDWNGVNLSVITSGEFFVGNDVPASATKYMHWTGTDLKIRTTGEFFVGNNVPASATKYLHWTGTDLNIVTGGSISIASGGSISIASGGSIGIASGGGIDIASGGNIDIQASSGMTVTSGTVDFAAGTDLKMIGTTGNSSTITFTKSTSTTVGQVYSSATDFALHIDGNALSLNGGSVSITNGTSTISIGAANTISVAATSTLGLSGSSVSITGSYIFNFSASGLVTTVSAPLGSSGVRWSTIYGAALNLSGTATIGSSTIAEASSFLVTDSTAGLLVRVGGNNKVVIDNAQIYPYTTKGMDNGIAGNMWNNTYSATYYDDGGGYNDTLDDLTILHAMRPSREKDKHGLDKLDIYSLPDFLLNKEAIYKKVKQDNGDLIKDSEIEELINDPDELGFMLKRNLGKFNDIVAGAVRQLDIKVNKLIERINNGSD